MGAKRRKALRKEEDRRREAVFEDGEVFGEKLYLKGEEKLALSKAWNNSRHYSASPAVWRKDRGRYV